MGYARYALVARVGGANTWPRRLWRLRRERLKQQVAVDLHPPPLFMRELSFSAQRYPWFCSALALAQVSPGVLALLSPAWFHVNQDSRDG